MKFLFRAVLTIRPPMKPIGVRSSTSGVTYRLAPRRQSSFDIQPDSLVAYSGAVVDQSIERGEWGTWID
ncbi:uncharacterized protein EAF01_005724 [Botrytis porri]|uniref:uncharacterized protein n=1 Tax=Botrytis porri TaxID=87229 RepID=UPI0018FFF272|nr:uncharacterized protein EAF01_005724 [Botrytis porri]KAF7905203.1 hypothetical protein EAF01_005724 [Botrytis porri]